MKAMEVIEAMTERAIGDFAVEGSWFFLLFLA